jgi:hypothetical protein
MQASGDSIISIHITNEDFREKLIAPPDDSVYRSGAKFVEYMKGLYLEAAPAGETGTMYMINLNDVDTRLSLYYRNTDFPDSTMTLNYFISERANINLFGHDHSTAVFAEQLGQTGTLIPCSTSRASQASWGALISNSFTPGVIQCLSALIRPG